MVFVFVANAHDPVTAAFVRNVCPVAERFLRKDFVKYAPGMGLCLA
jgi:hypothetical protein